MSNSNPPDGGFPNANPSEVQVVFAGDLADDDHLWVVHCSIDELRRMFINPVAWVASLGTLPEWRAPEGAERRGPVLTDDFAIVALKLDGSDEKGWVTVQGISDTNAITIVASRRAAIHAAHAVARDEKEDGTDPFGAFWRTMASDPDNQPSGKKPFPVLALDDLARWYGHFEVRDAVTTPAELATKTVAFLLATLHDPEGYAAMLTSLDHQVRRIREGREIRGAPLRVAPPKRHPTSTFYANVVAKTPALTQSPDGARDEPGPDLPDMFLCTAVTGPLIPDEDTGENEGGMIKRYGAESPDPAPPSP